VSEHEIDLRDRDREREHGRNTQERHRFTLRRYRGEFVEAEDIHFHLNSAVLMPDSPTPPGRSPTHEHGRVAGLAVLRACYLYARDNPGKKLVVVGHADRSGRLGYNLGLSRLRARGSIAALTGDRDNWADIADGRHRTRDVQQILRWVARTRDWHCDPVLVDDIPGDLTRNAILGFQASYNRAFDASIAEDGIVVGIGGRGGSPGAALGHRDRRHRA
jgi:hypothetical protein